MVRSFNLCFPPRPIPWSLEISIIFGNIVAQVGWGLFAFGMIFFWVFCINADVSFLTFRGQIETTQGMVNSVHKTAFSEGNKNNSRHVCAFQYSFDVDGKKYSGVSYMSGMNFAPGASVSVEYLKENPEKSRIQGMHRNVFGPWVLFVGLFPFLGLCLLLFGMKNGLNNAHLLANGNIAYGTLKKKEDTGGIINNRTVYEMTFEFVADDRKTYKVIAQSHTPEILEDQKEEPLLYEPLNPSFAVLMDNLPGAPRVDELGNVHSKNLTSPMLAMILPTITILGHGIYAYIHFFM